MSESENISLAEVLKRVIKTFKLLLKKKYIIILFTLLFGALGFLKVKRSTVQYQADVSFMIESSSSGGLSKAMSLARNFGLLGGKGAQINQETLVEIATSKNIVELALNNVCEVNGKSDLLSNHFLEVFEIKENWKNDKIDISDFKFGVPSALDSIHIQQRMFRSAYSEIYSEVLKVTADEDVGIIEIKILSPNEDFSYHLINAIYNELAEFYFMKSFSSDEKNLKILDNDCDSILRELNIQESVLAQLRDSRVATVKSKGFLDLMQKEREVKILNLMYAEIYKNKEMLEFSIKTNEIPFKKLESPRYPLVKKSESLIKTVIIWMILGCFLIVFILLSIEGIKWLKRTIGEIEKA